MPLYLHLDHGNRTLQKVLLTKKKKLHRLKHLMNPVPVALEAM
jgi:hypothetical protein